jgi:hypothetical protein
MVRVFLSHSSRDDALVKGLLELLRASLRLRAEDIRCTSIDGYRLPVGATTADHLRVELLEVPVLVGLISEASFESAYVLFELGARWGTGKPLMPLLAPGVAPSILRGPLAALNALSCSVPAQLHQFVTDLAGALEITPEPPASYQAYIEALASLNQSTATLTPQHHGAPASGPAVPDLGPPDVPPNVFKSIRAEAQRRHPNNFGMQEYVESQELAAYRRLQAPRTGGAA